MLLLNEQAFTSHCVTSKSRTFLLLFQAVYLVPPSQVITILYLLRV